MRKTLPALLLLCALLLCACGTQSEEPYSLTLWYSEEPYSLTLWYVEDDSSPPSRSLYCMREVGQTCFREGRGA